MLNLHQYLFNREAVYRRNEVTTTIIKMNKI